MTPQYLMNSSVDNFNFEPDQISQRSGSTSSDDLRSEATASTAKNETSSEAVDMIDTIENENFEMRNVHDDKEEELCQLGIFINWREIFFVKLFTIPVIHKNFMKFHEIFAKN